MILSASSVGESILVTVLGLGVVFLGLIALLLVVAAIGIFFKKKMDAKAKAPAAAVQPVEESADAPLAPGSAGQLKLHDVEPKTAAMLMAIVADTMGKPLNELHFISIKEVK